MLAQYARFLVVGAGNAIVDLGLLNLLLLLHPAGDDVTLVVDNTIAVAGALLNSYLWNPRWTFRSQVAHAPRQRVLFVAQGLLNLLISNLVLLAVVEVLPPVPSIWYGIANNGAKLVAMVAASTTSFVLLRTFVFRAR